MTVYCLGSINIDKVIQVPRFAGPGETLAATGYVEGLGGKGANQSVAAVRAGAVTRHIGRVGADGTRMLARLAEHGVDVSAVDITEASTGAAFIQVTPDGENSIVILAGANHGMEAAKISQTLANADQGDTLILQNETNGQVEAAAAAAGQGLRVVYSAAPFEAAAVGALLPYLTVLLLNEIEASQLSTALARSVAALGVPYVVVTRGAAGASLYAQGEERTFPSPKVTPVDTTGAGDTFAGYLAASLDQGLDWPQAMERALSAAALSVTKFGAAASIPSADETDAFMSSLRG